MNYGYFISAAVESDGSVTGATMRQSLPKKPPSRAGFGSVIPMTAATPDSANVSDPRRCPARIKSTQQHGRFMAYLIAYVVVLIVFGAIDACWLTFMGPHVYRPTLGDILAPGVRIGPAIAFYLCYPIGVVVFGVLPGLRAESVTSAFLLAVLFGAVAYGTYDLTNYATLRNWTLQITLLDIVYGALLSGVAAIAAYALVRVTVGSSSAS